MAWKYAFLTGIELVFLIPILLSKLAWQTVSKRLMKPKSQPLKHKLFAQVYLDHNKPRIEHKKIMRYPS